MGYINEYVAEQERRTFLIPGYLKEHTPGIWAKLSIWY